MPGIVISPYAKQGYIDHQTLSFDAYDKFIEDDFLGGQRLNPATDGRPDPRPSVRENEKILGNLVNDFDFNQSPRAGAHPSGAPQDDADRHTHAVAGLRRQGARQRVTRSGRAPPWSPASPRPGPPGRPGAAPQPPCSTSASAGARM